MQLSHLLSIYPQTSWRSGMGEREVSQIVFDSRKLEPGCVFVAIRGGRADGHAFLGEAVAKGAIALVVEDLANVPGEFRGGVVIVRDTRDALNKLASRFFGEPARQMFCVGVTGTNGKTTTTHVVEAIFNEGGRPTGVIGTIDHHLGSRVWKTEMTTPDPISFQLRLSEFLSHGAQAVAMEVSSHALHQSRVDEVPFDVAIFSNLTRDHLDYHKDMDDYFAAKRKLFTELLARSMKPMKTAIINADDAYGRKLMETRIAGIETWSYGAGADASLRFEVLEQGFQGSRFKLRTPRGIGELFVRMPGLHNVYNASSAVGAGLAAGLDFDTCAKALDGFMGVKGRLESVPNPKGVHVFVDYAHSDDAIATVLHYLGAIRRHAKLENRLITVFGCGGDRDKGKRPLMMKAAAKGSDLVVLTSDNPRTEDPGAILKDAAAGADPSTMGKTLFIEVDRKQGIRKALDLAKKGDVVLIAGKGHEDYQIIGTTRTPFSDAAVVKEILG